MRVQGTSSTVAGGARAVRRSRAEGGFRLGASGVGVGGPGPAGQATGLASIEALLALQGIDGPDATEAGLVARGHDLLDGLRRLQDDLLAGRLDRRALEDLRRQLGRDPGYGHDPKLAAILRDIDVRAAVELAKQGVAEAPPPPASIPAAVGPRRALLGAYAPVRL